MPRPSLVPALAVLVILAGCAPRPEGPAGDVGFVNRVWRVSASTAVAPGTQYVFLAESTLVVHREGDRPAFGTWRRDGDGLVMVEDGLAYPTDILELTGERFRIRSHNPGAPVDITLVPAPTAR